MKDLDKNIFYNAAVRMEENVDCCCMLLDEEFGFSNRTFEDGLYLTDTYDYFKKLFYTPKEIKGNNSVERQWWSTNDGYDESMARTIALLLCYELLREEQL